MQISALRRFRQLSHLARTSVLSFAVSSVSSRERHSAEMEKCPSFESAGSLRNSRSAIRHIERAARARAHDATSNSIYDRLVDRFDSLSKRPEDARSHTRSLGAARTTGKN